MSPPGHRVGLIGLGAAVRKHVLALGDLDARATIVACWSPSEARRSGFAAQTGLPVVDQLDAIFDDRFIDTVLILSPPWSHLDLVARAAAAGKHVVLEKPIEATLERARQAVEACARAGTTLAVVFQNRFRSPHLRLRQLLQAESLGRPVSVSLAMRWWRPAGYFAEAGRGTMARDGGGVLLSQAIHTIDQLVDLFGLPQDVFGFTATSPLRAIDTEDIVSASLRWPGGAIGTLDATTAQFPTSPERIDIAAERGSALLERTRLRVWLHDGTVIDDAEDPADPAVAGDYLAHRRLLAETFDAIDAGRTPRSDGSSGLGAHRLIDAILRSASCGAPTRPGSG